MDVKQFVVTVVLLHDDVAKCDVCSVMDVVVVMATLWNRAGHYIFALWFLLSSSSSSFCLFSSPNLSRRRLDVYRTSTHGVALVRIQDAGLKHAARGLLKIQDAKNRQKFAICAPSYNFVGLYLRN